MISTDGMSDEIVGQRRRTKKQVSLRRGDAQKKIKRIEKTWEIT